MKNDHDIDRDAATEWNDRDPESIRNDESIPGSTPEPDGGDGNGDGRTTDDSPGITGEGPPPAHVPFLWTLLGLGTLATYNAGAYQWMTAILVLATCYGLGWVFLYKYFLDARCERAKRATHLTPPPGVGWGDIPDDEDAERTLRALPDDVLDAADDVTIRRAKRKPDGSIGYDEREVDSLDEVFDGLQDGDLADVFDAAGDGDDDDTDAESETNSRRRRP